MNSTQVVETLRKEAATNSAFNAVCHVFALRQRARHQVTIQSLHYRMLKEGFSYPKTSYQQIIKMLGDLGFGAVKYDKRGEPIGIFGVNNTLQSIGKAALGGESKLKGYKQRHRYSDLPAVLNPTKKVEPKKTPPKASDTTTRVYPVSLTVVIAGKPVNFRIPTNITAEEIQALVERFSDRAMETKDGPAVEFPVAMTAVVEGTPVSLQVPKNITSKEIANLVVRFHDKGGA